MKTYLSIFLVTFLLAGCGSQPKYGDAKKWLPEPLPGDGRLFVYRPRNIFATFSPFTFTMDGQEIMDFYSGTGFYLDVKAGNHEISFNGGKGKLSVNVPENGSVYLKYRVVTDDVDKSNFVVSTIPSDVADQEMDDMFLIEAKMPTVRGIQLRL